MAITLPADYYLDNFRHLVDFVAERYWPLLSDAEQHFYQRFSALPREGQMLYIRLLSRKGELFLQRKLNYAEIGNIAEAAAQLHHNELLQFTSDLPLQQALPLFSKSEIIERLQQPSLRRLSRQQLEQQLLDNESRHDELSQQLLAPEHLYQVLDKPHFATFKLCFFGNLRQDLTDYVLRDLGLQHYEPYPLERQQLLFGDRAQIDRHLHYYRCSEELPQSLLDGSEAILALWQQLPPADPQDALLTRRRERMANTLARQLERLQQPQLALEIYSQVKRPPARERRARIITASGDIEAALELCRQIARQPINEEERQFAQEFGYRQAKKTSIPWPAPTRYQPPLEHITLANSDHSVEFAVAEHLGEYGPCYFVENSLVNGVLGLAIWDIIFAPLRGAFFNPFQYAPSDFYEAEFTQRRAGLLEQRLDEILDSARLGDIVMGHYQRKNGLANPLVNWQRLTEELLLIALQRIPARDWQVMLQRLLADLQHHRNGMPDLIAFPDTGGYQWLEVKGPGDKLQKNQLRWLAFFADHDIDHRVIHVSWLPQ